MDIPENPQYVKRLSKQKFQNCTEDADPGLEFAGHIPLTLFINQRRIIRNPSISRGELLSFPANPFSLFHYVNRIQF